MQAPHDRDWQRQYQYISHDVEDAGKAREGREVDTTASRNRLIPNEGDRSALERGSKNRCDAQNHSSNAKKHVTQAPFRRGILIREETTVEEEDGELGARYSNCPEVLENPLNL